MENPIHLLSSIPLPFFLHLGGILAIIALYYWKGRGSKEFCFSYFAIGVVVFSLCFLLERVKLELGFALGLFAIFGIIRYRTITIPIKEMTYLFVVIGVSVINALANGTLSPTTLLAANLAIILCLAVLETFLMKNHEGSIMLRYEKIENLKNGRRAVLIADLRERIDLEVTDYQVENVDFLRDTANLRVYYNSPKPNRKVEDVSHSTDRLVFDR